MDYDIDQVGYGLGSRTSRFVNLVSRKFTFLGTTEIRPNHRKEILPKNMFFNKYVL